MANRWELLRKTSYITHSKTGRRVNLPPGETCFFNNKYTVIKREIESDITGAPSLYHLSIRRNDREPIHDWRDLQRIKNQLCGKNSCGIEFYPPENKLVDTANQYHLWVFEDDRFFPFMFQDRMVSEDESIGNKQRPFDEEYKPDDLLTTDDMLKRFK